MLLEVDLEYLMEMVGLVFEMMAIVGGGSDCDGNCDCCV